MCELPRGSTCRWFGSSGRCPEPTTRLTPPARRLRSSAPSPSRAPRHVRALHGRVQGGARSREGGQDQEGGSRRGRTTASGPMRETGGGGSRGHRRGCRRRREGARGEGKGEDGGGRIGGGAMDVDSSGFEPGTRPTGFYELHAVLTHKGAIRGFRTTSRGCGTRTTRGQSSTITSPIRRSWTTSSRSRVGATTTWDTSSAQSKARGISYRHD